MAQSTRLKAALGLALGGPNGQNLTFLDRLAVGSCWLAALGATTAQVQGSEDYVCLYKDRSQLSGPWYDQSLL